MDVTSPVLSDGTATYTPGISERRGGATTYEHSDYLGSVTRQTDASQATTATRTFDAFGLLVASTGTPQGPFGFVGSQGYQSDADSGLMLLGHRYYDPSTGRFLTRDPAKDGRNWYGYCGSNPTRWADPTGEIIPLLVIGIAILVVALSTETADAPTSPDDVGSTHGGTDPRIGIGVGGLLIASGRPVEGALTITGISGIEGTTKGPNQFNNDPTNPGLRWDVRKKAPNGT